MGMSAVNAVYTHEHRAAVVIVRRRSHCGGGTWPNYSRPTSYEVSFGPVNRPRKKSSPDESPCGAQAFRLHQRSMEWGRERVKA